MASSYDGNCSSYWSYSPYPYSNSYDTSSSNSSYFESPMSSSSSSSPHMIMCPVYDQQQPGYYYYSDGTFPYHQLSPPIVPSSQIGYVPSLSPPLPRSTTNLPNRLQYTIRQRWLLNEIFEHVPYPNSIQKNVIADRIGATREQIRIWFQNRRRISVQSHRSSSRRINPLPIDNNHLIQLELEEILADLELHKNAPQRMPIGQSISSRRVRVMKK
ncbi:unnamed protein product [Rotaria sordida]|uniref:Homeobox domain-containing protein n=1 Tax=Rotaria sordida TaxID=392033 RepID=A0A818L389_9BILA|nr:unnamed protein product [Rotaria sordida]CAF0851358.1 unnamed protein product [Rotaria sordida]CAF0909495.1 unnamed protein product [Rotaria sordida]CAF1046562.1 unnamed protein product [Rotaria sordida]CAF3564410.1 unnamed protein product [Rotaria sordida]